MQSFIVGIKLGIEHPGIDALMTKQTRTLAIRNVDDDEHFTNGFLDKWQSGRYRTMKDRGAWGRDCFLRHLIHTLSST